MAETVATLTECQACLLADGNSSRGSESFTAFFSNLFQTEGFPPRWECGTGWTSTLGWLHIVSDLAIFGAYFAIPVVLAYFLVRRKDIPFPPILWLFVAFIALCGFGHAVEGSMFWVPWYRLSGLVKGATAIVSWVTVIALIRIVPQALTLPGLAKLNEALNREVAERERVETKLRQRAEDLEAINRELVAADRSTVSREERVIALKEEVNRLLSRLGETPRYRNQFDS